MKLLFNIIIVIEKFAYWYGRAVVKSIISKLGECGESDISYPITIKTPKNIYISNGVKIGPNCLLGAFSNIYIGNNSRISSNCIIETASLNLARKDYGVHSGKEIIIGNNVWIGAGCIILAGTIIGDNTVVTAGSVTSGRIPENSIFKNNNSKIRKYE